jgi:hypothetical protein
MWPVSAGSPLSGAPLALRPTLTHQIIECQRLAREPSARIGAAIVAPMDGPAAGARERDELKRHPSLDERLDPAIRLTRDLVQRAPGDRLAYIAGKREYLDELELRARAWTADQPGS